MQTTVGCLRVETNDRRGLAMLFCYVSPPDVATVRRMTTLPFRAHGDSGPLVILLHWLGGDASTWDDLGEGLVRRGYQTRAIDLPGFGAARSDARFDVAAMADAVTETLPTLLQKDTAWILGGHSMGGKVAAVLARRAAAGEARLAGLAGIVLVSPSPPEPEPMGEEKRREMREKFASGRAAPDEEQKNSRTFVQENVGSSPLPSDRLERAAALVEGRNEAAWRAWLDGGSKEDWGAFVGRLPKPMMVVYGEDETPLGTDAQKKLIATHAENPRAVREIAFSGAGHLSPLERTGELVDHVVTFARSIHVVPEMSPAMRDFVASSLVSPQTRRVLLERLDVGDEPAAKVFRDDERQALRSLVASLVPGAPPEIAVRIETRLASGRGDGWRHAELPPDAAAWRRGLATLESRARRKGARSFAALRDDDRDAMLHEVFRGKESAAGEDAQLTADALRLWITDACTEIVQMYLSDPRGAERIGFRGFGDERGFTQIRLGEHGTFEP